jgi:hypothetical protein
MDLDTNSLRYFEPPKALIESSVRAFRLLNTVVDIVFYDVPGLPVFGPGKGDAAQGGGATTPRPGMDFDALTDPEGSLLLFDVTTAPHALRFTDVGAFLNSEDPRAKKVSIVTITGVGSSALGSAAFAWDVSTALKQAVLAIVPGYGLADVVTQGLGGWFGFGLHNFLQTKSLVQSTLASVAPKTAEIGRHLSATAPGATTIHGAPVFRYGSGSSDVLHDLLNRRSFELLIGHSKGALQIGNAIQSLQADRTEALKVVTLGCPIATNVANVTYYQYLGLFDALGQMNMWGNLPSEWVPTWHTTDPWLPPAMATGELVNRAA